MKLRSWFPAGLAACALVAAAPANAGTTYKTGADFATSQANCFPLSGRPSYTQQTATGSTTGIEPKVDDVFYVSLTVSFFQTFDCAADFFFDPTDAAAERAARCERLGDPDLPALRRDEPRLLLRPACARRVSHLDLVQRLDPAVLDLPARRRGGPRLPRAGIRGRVRQPAAAVRRRAVAAVRSAAPWTCSSRRRR